MKGDRETLTEIRTALKATADRLYEKDGGRDLPADQHPRTRSQRLFDAAAHHLLGSGSHSRRAPGVRSMLHLRLIVDDATGDLIRTEAPGGAGLLPRSVVERYACVAEVAATVFDQRGHTLWHGRAKRYATDEQFTALVARDGGCVLCSASPEHCVAHHLIPYGAPARGRTDIDDLALVCVDCHHHVHDNRLTLRYRTGPPARDGTPTFRWTTRPATPDEIPPSRSAASAA